MAPVIEEGGVFVSVFFFFERGRNSIQVHLLLKKKKKTKPLGLVFQSFFILFFSSFIPNFSFNIVGAQVFLDKKKKV
jgi:hypothetical protein